MKEICKKIEQEVNDYKQKMIRQGAEHCYNNSYEISIMEELNYFFTDYVKDLDEYDEFDVEKIKKYDKLATIDNLCNKIVNFYYGMRHPEYYDFHNIESLIDIIDSFIKESDYTKEIR